MRSPFFLKDNIIDGRAFSQSILASVTEKIKTLETPPKLAVIMVGNHGPSEIYVHHKQRVAKEVGIEAILHHVDEGISQEKLDHLIDSLNKDTSVHGILLQLPLPVHLDRVRSINAISPLKDVDGLTFENQGLLFAKRPRIIPCTPLGCFYILRELIDLKGANVTIVGRSFLVGRPLAALLMNYDATVTLTHRFTENLKDHCKDSDVIISAVGRPGLIREDFVKEGAVVLDVGITRVETETVGDVDFARVSPKCKAITPVPGGIGPMTIACLMENTVKAMALQTV